MFKWIVIIIKTTPVILYHCWKDIAPNPYLPPSPPLPSPQPTPLTSRWHCCLRNLRAAVQATSFCLCQHASVQRSMCTCASQPFRGICVKFMMCVGCSQGVMHEKECACMHVPSLECMQRPWLERVFLFWKRNKEKSAVCMYSVCVCVCSGASCLGEPPAVWGNGASHCGGKRLGWWLLCLLL